jgi:hypothetical protein
VVPAGEPSVMGEQICCGEINQTSADRSNGGLNVAARIRTEGSCGAVYWAVEHSD